MMPGISGFELAHRLKADARAKLIPIIFLTALDSEDDLLQGFQLGADDYIAKPFSVREVLARVRAVLARTAQEADTTPVAIVQEADASAIAISIDAVAKTIAIDGRAMPFTPTEFNLLKTLIESGRTAMSREELLRQARQSAEDYLRPMLPEKKPGRWPKVLLLLAGMALGFGLGVLIRI